MAVGWFVHGWRGGLKTVQRGFSGLQQICEYRLRFGGSRCSRGMPTTTFGAADNLAPGLTRTTYRRRLTAPERRMCA
jgi:hypothetical protein